MIKNGYQKDWLTFLVKLSHSFQGIKHLLGIDNFSENLELSYKENIIF